MINLIKYSFQAHNQGDNDDDEDNELFKSLTINGKYFERLKYKKLKRATIVDVFVER